MTGTAQHVLVVGGGREVPHRFRDLGARTTTMCRMVVLDSVREPARNASLHALPDDADVAWWVAVADVLHRLDPFTAVASFSELDQDKAAAVAEHLGLRWHHPATVAAVHDKLRMRRLLRERGADDVRAISVTLAGDVLTFGAEVGWPLVVKPSSGWASAGVSVVRGPADVEAAIARGQQAEVHQGHALMAEEHLAGREYSVEALSESDDHQVVAITQKETDPATSIEIGHLVPATLPAADADRIAGFVTGALSALGIRDGLTHTEVMLGPGGEVHMIETHTRPAGDDISLLVADAVGVDLVGEAIAQTLGEQILPGIRAQLATGRIQHAAISFVLPDVQGEVVSVEGPATVESIPGVRDVKVTVSPGDVVGPARDSFGRVAHVRTLAPTPEVAVDLAQHGAATIQVVVRDPAPEQEPPPRG